jgi:hypothetical protein
MTSYCCICKVSLQKGVSGFRFPENSYERNEWVVRLGLSESDLGCLDSFGRIRSVRVCQIHFNATDIVTNARRRQLRRGAKPISAVVITQFRVDISSRFNPDKSRQKQKLTMND